MINNATNSVSEGIKKRVEDGTFNKMATDFGNDVKGLGAGMVSIVDMAEKAFGNLKAKVAKSKAEREQVAAEIRQRGIRRREFERFITTLETLPDEVTDFSEDLWGSLVEYLTVYAKDDLRFMLPCEVEITA